jgi:hypothetical protein
MIPTSAYPHSRPLRNGVPYPQARYSCYHSSGSFCDCCTVASLKATVLSLQEELYTLQCLLYKEHQLEVYLMNQFVWH